MKNPLKDLFAKDIVGRISPSGEWQAVILKADAIKVWLEYADELKSDSDLLKGHADTKWRRGYLFAYREIANEIWRSCK